MQGLLILISVICVPILGMLAIGQRMKRQEQDQVRKKRESEALKNLYEQQL